MDDDTPENNLPSPERSAAVWDPVLDGYYDLIDKDSGTIEFRKKHAAYKMMRSAMMGLGVDLDSIKTEQALIALENKHIDYLHDLVEAQVLNDKSQHLEDQLIKAIYRNDKTEADRIRKLLKKRKQISLRITK